jgi:hypothetical protein
MTWGPPPRKLAIWMAARSVQGAPGSVDVQLPLSGVVWGASCVVVTVKVAAWMEVARGSPASQRTPASSTARTAQVGIASP